MSFLRALLEVFQVTAPIFIVIAAGLIIRKIKIISDGGVSLLNRLAYNIGLPALFFLNITEYRLSEIFDIDIIKVIYSTYGIYFIILVLLSFLIKRNRRTRGAFIVSSFRSNMAFVGLPIVWAAYGALALARASLVIAFLVPVNIIATVLIFKFFNRGEEKLDAKKLIRNFATDPIIIATLLGIIFSYFGLGLPGFIHDSLDIISGMTVAIALLSIGASFRFDHLRDDLKANLYISLNKLILLPAIVFLVATFIYKTDTFDRNVMVILFATPLAVAAYIMAKELRSNHNLMASALIITTIISALTISGWLLVFKYL